MGHQQALLATLAMLTIGLSVRIGVRLVEQHYQQQNRDQITAHCQRAYMLAETYAARPKAQGGGGGSYRGFRLSKAAAKLPTGAVTASISGTSNMTLTATGTVRGNNSRTPVRVVMTVRQRKITKVTFSN